MNKKIKKSVRVVDRNKKKNTPVKSLTIKKETMSKTKKNSGTVGIRDSKKTTTNKTNTRMDLKQVLEEIKGLPDDPILFDGFDDHIIGYDLESNSVIYEGYGIINQILEINMEYDEAHGGLDGEWEDYYDRAYEYMSNCLAHTNIHNWVAKGKRVNLKDDRPYPIIMMGFIN